MTLREFPSEVFPAFPSIKVEAGEAWKNWNFPGTIIALKKPKGESFTSNILINVRHVGLDYRLDNYKSEIKGYANNLLDIKYISEGLHDVNGVEWEVIEYAYIDETSGPLAQLLAACLVKNGSTQSLFTFTGTVSLSNQKDNQDYQEIQDVLRSAKIDE
jgi:hypothetical protein